MANPLINVIVQTALSRGVPLPAAQVLAAQAVHESGNFTSHNFKANNNLYGMTVATTRPNHQAGGAQKQPDGNSKYAYYRTPADSVHDLIDYLTYRKIDLTKVKSAKDYAAILKSKGYYGASLAEYVHGLTNGLHEVTAALQTGLTPSVMFGDEKKKRDSLSLYNLYVNISNLFKTRVRR